MGDTRHQLRDPGEGDLRVARIQRCREIDDDEHHQRRDQADGGQRVYQGDRHEEGPREGKTVDRFPAAEAALVRGFDGGGVLDSLRPVTLGAGREDTGGLGQGTGSLWNSSFPQAVNQEPLGRLSTAGGYCPGDYPRAGAGNFRRADERAGPEPDRGGSAFNQGHRGRADGDPVDAYPDGGAGDMRQHHDDRGGSPGVHGHGRGFRQLHHAELVVCLVRGRPDGGGVEQDRGRSEGGGFGPGQVPGTFHGRAGDDGRHREGEHGERVAVVGDTGGEE